MIFGPHAYAEHVQSGNMESLQQSLSRERALVVTETVYICASTPFVTTQIFLRHTADIRSDSGCPTPCEGCNTLHYRTPCAQLGRVSRCFPLLQVKYFSDILRTSGRTPDVRICAMAAAFLYYRTTRAQLGRMFRCFSFHNISPFLLPDLFSSLPCLSN